MPEMKPQSRNHLGKGLSFPLRVNVQGGLQLSSADRNVEESIHIILRTELKERVYRPTFGSRMSELVFSPMNPQNLLLLRMHVREALEMWEPRIILQEVQTDPDPVRGKISIVILYRLKDSYDPRSLVFPFYLMPPS